MTARLLLARAILAAGSVVVVVGVAVCLAAVALHDEAPG